MEPTKAETPPSVVDPEQAELGIFPIGEESAVRLGKWQHAKETLADLDNAVEANYLKARALEVKTPNDRELAGQLVAFLKNEAKMAEATLAPFESPLKRVADWLRQKRQKVTNRCEEARGILNAKMATYDRAEEAKAAADEKRRQEAAAKANEKQAKLELKAGDISKQEFKTRVENPPTVKVSPVIPTIAGNVRRINYSASCMNPGAFLKALCEAYADRKHRESYELFMRLAAIVVVSDQKLSAEARRLIKTSPQDDKHELTVEQFKKLYPFVNVDEDRTY